MAWKAKDVWLHRLTHHRLIRSGGTVIHYVSKVVHRLLMLGVGLLVVIGVMLTAGAWRLAQGPIDLGWLTDRVKAALVDDAGPMHVSFGRLALAWEGFHKGVDYPIDLRVSDITVTTSSGNSVIVAPDAHVTFSLAGLLLGRLVPRTIEVDHARVDVTGDLAAAISGGETNHGDPRAADIDSLDLRLLRDQLKRPAGTDHSRSHDLLDQIRRAHFRDVEITLRDQASAFLLRASASEIELTRVRNGRIRGVLRTSLAMGNARTAMTVTTDLVPGEDSSVAVEVGSFRPSALGPLPSAFVALSQIDTPISLVATIVVDAAFQPKHLEAAATLGSGQIQIGQGALPVVGGAIMLSGSMDELTIARFHLDLAQTAARVVETLDLTGNIKHVSDRIALTLAAGVEQIAVADLPKLWPAGLGGNARQWIIEHVTGGIVTHGTISLAMEADQTLREIVLTKATGEIDGVNATFTWLDDMPPVEHAEVHLRLADPDILDIHLTSGRQRVSGSVPDLRIKDGKMQITGLSRPDQKADIHIQVEGQIQSTLSLLSEPRLHLLSVHPLAVKPTGGEASASLYVGFPLRADLQIDDVLINADAHVTHLRLPDVVGPHELTDGIFDLAVDKDTLRFKGGGSLATVTVSIEGRVDFAAGPSDQVVQKVTVSGQPSATQLDTAGLPVTAFMDGPVSMTALVVQRRNGDGSVSIEADLTPSGLKIEPLAWTKPKGTTAGGTISLQMSHNRLVKIDRFAFQGDTMLVNGSAKLSDGHLRSVLLDKIRFGRTQGHGTINIATNNRMNLVLQGSQIDLTAKLAERSPLPNPSNIRRATTPSWTLSARFDHAILANDETLANVLAKATGDGDTIQTLDAIGATGAGDSLSVKIEPKTGTRHLLVDAKDAGRFLRGVDAVRVLQSGHLTIDAGFEMPYGSYPVAGTAIIQDVVVQNSPVLGKVLQAITLYGLVDALRGPGMTFSNIVVPFRYDGVSLAMHDAHANNASLGLTAMGEVNLRSGQAAITGTIVPAYFFNAMLGQLPLVGKLFSPEKGGGIFAARFGINGSIEDPAISINTISALTPGFMREIFNGFDNLGGSSPGVPPKPP